MYRQGVQVNVLVRSLKMLPFRRFVIATGTLATGDAGQAAKAFVETENPIENLDAGPVFMPREDYGKVPLAADAKTQNAIPLLDTVSVKVYLGTRKLYAVGAVPRRLYKTV